MLNFKSRITLVQYERRRLQLGRLQYWKLFVDFTATPDGVLRKTGCRKPLARAKKGEEQISRERAKRRDREIERCRRKRRQSSKGVKGENDLQLVGAFERDLPIWISRVLTRRCVPLYCVCQEEERRNKHIKRHDSFTLDKNMSRDTYLDPLLLISAARASVSLS